MFQSLRRWIHDLRISDPVTHQQAVLLQILLIGMLLTLVLAILLNIVVFRSAALTLNGLTPNLLLLICIASALLVLRRGRFRLSVGIVVAALLVGQAYTLLTGGVQHNPGQLLVFMIPLVLAGLLLGRYALIATAGLSILVTIVTIELEQLADVAVQPPSPPIGATLVLFVLVVAVLGLSLDRFGSAFRSALASATALAGDNARLYRVAQEQQARLQATLASIGDAVITTDTAGRVTFLNNVAESLTGWPQFEALEQHLDDVFVIVNEETREPVDSPVARVLREGTVVGLANHTVLLARDRHEVPIDDSGAPIRDVAGKLIGVVLVFHDISERRQAEDALREREMLFRTMADSAPVLLWVFGTDMLRTFFNQPWLDFTGRTLEQEVGYGWAEGVHPDDYQRCLEIYISSFHQRHPFSMDYRLRRADGEYRWIFDNGVPCWTPDGVFAGYIGSCIDITERREAEERKRMLVEVSSQLNDSLDYDTTLHQMVEFFVPHFADYCLLHVVEEPERYRQAAAAHVNHNQQLLLEELGRLERSGSDAANSLIVQILQTGRPVLRARMSHVDVESTSTNADVLRIYRTLDPVSLLIVPLVARGQVRGALTLATSESRRQYDRRDLAFVEDLASRCALALDNAGLYREAQRAIVVRDQFLAIASHELKTPLTAMLGYTQLLQRRNEREHLLGEREGTIASIAVSDEGIGIPESAILNLFRRFYRAPNVNPLHISGTGIGLYVVREIVTHHGGTIEVTSTEGAGSTFRVTLPLKEAQPSDGATR